MKPFGKYQLVRRIAAGGMAEVYLATGPNPRSAELIALKLILQHIAEDESFMAMFLQEARLTAPLIHPNLVQVFDLGMQDGRLYLAMEYIRGKSLNEVAARAEAKGNPLTAELAAAAVRQACLGLHHAHEARDAEGQDLGLIHRDVSPQNLMLDETGTVKVVDFGVAKATSQSEVSRAGTLKGKVGFMSPEQLKSKPLDRRVDVFALGVVLFELSTGKPLFQGRNDAEILQRMLFETPPNLKGFGLSAPLVKIIATATERDRSKRYPTAEKMAEALGEFLGPELANTTAQLSSLVQSLFSPFPRTVAEADAEISSPGRKREPGEPVPVSRPERTRQATPTDPMSRKARAREASLPIDRDTTIGGRSGERSGGRPRIRTGPTDPGAMDGGNIGTEIDARAFPAPPDENEIQTKLNRDEPGPASPDSPAPSDSELPTDRNRRAPTGQVAQWDAEEATVSTVSDSVRPRPKASEPLWRQLPIPAIALGAVGVPGLLALFWWVLSSSTPPPAPSQVQVVHVVQTVDAGPAPVAEAPPAPVPDAGAPPALTPSPTPPPAPAAPVAKMGALTLLAPKGMSVTIDGRSAGTTPIRNLPVPIGRRRVTVTASSGKRAQYEAVIREHRNYELRVKLK